MSGLGSSTSAAAAAALSELQPCVPASSVGSGGLGTAVNTLVLIQSSNEAAELRVKTLQQQQEPIRYVPLVPLAVPQPHRQRHKEAHAAMLPGQECRSSSSSRVLRERREAAFKRRVRAGTQNMHMRFIQQDILYDQYKEARR